MDEGVQPQEEVLSQEQPPEKSRDSSQDEPGISGSDGRIKALENELGASKDKYVRLLAEFDNMRKRYERDRLELIKYAHEEVIVESLKIYDDLERSLRAFKAKEGMDANLVKGLEMVFNNMKDLMNRYDVKPIESVGKPFDHNAQEILMQQDSTELPDGEVIEEFEKGYTLGGRVVRTAKVKVAKHIEK